MIIENQILEVFRKVFNDPNLMISSSMVTGDLPGWDSFKNVEILLACEADLGIRFRSKEMDAIESIGDLIEACEAKYLAKNA